MSEERRTKCPFANKKGFHCEDTLLFKDGVRRFVQSKGSEETEDLQVQCTCLNRNLLSRSTKPY